MSGRPVHLLAAAAIAAAASLFSINAASAGCYSCGASYGYAAPAAYYTAPVVYSYSYAAPAAYASSCGCGTSYGSAPSYGYAASTPMYVVNQGPSYAEPVTGYAEPTPSYGYGYGHRRAEPYYAGGGIRWHRRHWNRGYGARNFGGRYGYRGYGYQRFGAQRFGYQRFGYQRHRYGAVVPGARFGIRHPMVGPGGIYRGPRHPMVGPRGMWGGPRHAGGMTPGVVHPRMGGAGPRGPMMQGGPNKKMP